MQSGNGSVSGAANARRQRRLYRLAALALMALGVLFLAANLGLLRADVAWGLGVAGPALLIALGLLLLGRARLSLPMPAFAIERAQLECGALEVRSGQTDLEVRAFAGASQLAVGYFPSHSGPRLASEGARGRLVLERRDAWPYYPGRWRVALAKSLPWSLDLASSFGDFELDLRALTLASARIRSMAGSVDLTLPAQGPAEVEVELSLGDLTVRMPDGAAVTLDVQAGPLARSRVAAPHLQRVSPGRWVTQAAASSPPEALVVLRVRLGAGDLHVVQPK